MKQFLDKYPIDLSEATMSNDPNTELPQDLGPWQASENGKYIYSDDFAHDVTLTVSGDFPDEASRKIYSEFLAKALTMGCHLAFGEATLSKPDDMFRALNKALKTPNALLLRLAAVELARKERALADAYERLGEARAPREATATHESAFALALRDALNKQENTPAESGKS